jgi:hypothetical protein
MGLGRDCQNTLIRLAWSLEMRQMKSRKACGRSSFFSIGYCKAEFILAEVESLIWGRVRTLGSCGLHSFFSPDKMRGSQLTQLAVASLLTARTQANDTNYDPSLNFRPSNVTENGLYRWIGS